MFQPPKFGKYGPNRAGKPPTRRFNPGDRFEHPTEKSVYCIIGAFRLKDDPHEWWFYLEDQTGLSKQSRAMFALDVIANLTQGDTKRIVSEPFRDSYDAVQHFGQIPTTPGVRGDRTTVRNRDLLKWRKLD